MALIVFYEKPGCLNGEKQKDILRRAGHRLDCRNILEWSWSRQTLLPFVAGRSPVDSMNHTAPAVKNGEVVPKELDPEEALSLMIADAILIKRPLLEVDGLFLQGFDHPELNHYLGDWDGREDVVTCPNLYTISCDENKE